MMFDGKAGLFYTLELKTFSGSCSFERNKNEKGIIHYHQIESLRKFGLYQNVISGFLLDFRKTDHTYFLSIDNFDKLIDKVQKKNFNEEDMLQWGSPLHISKEKLKVNYRYDVEKFVNHFTSV